jgi:hypothetical protein
MGSTGLVVMSVINVLLLMRLIDSDFKSTRKTETVNGGKAHQNGNGATHVNGNGVHKHAD